MKTKMQEMQEMQDMDKFLINFDLGIDKMTSEDLWKFSKEIKNLLNTINDYFYKKDEYDIGIVRYSLESPYTPVYKPNRLTNFERATDAAYGVIYNPYKGIPGKIKDFKRYLERILERELSEHTIDMHIAIALEEQKDRRRKRNYLNKEYFLGFSNGKTNKPYTSHVSTTNFIKEYQYFKETLKIYFEAIDKQMEIFLLYLGIDKSSIRLLENSKNNMIKLKEKYISINERSGHLSVNIYNYQNTTNDAIIDIDTYSSEEDIFSIWTSSNYITRESVPAHMDDTVVREILREQYPEILLSQY